MPRVTITVPERTAQPYRFHLDRLSVTLGRGSDNDIAIDCGSVSSRHAEMRRVGGGYELRDMGSTNGIKLDDERFTAIPLRNGMSVKLGDVAFDFLLSDEELEILGREGPDDGLRLPRESETARPKLPPLQVREEEERHEPAPRKKNLVGYGVALVMILAVMAFFAGMNIRFRKETGGSLMNAIKAHRQAMNAAASKLLDTTPDAAAPTATPDAAAPTAAPDAAAPTAVPDAAAPVAVPDAAAPATPDAATPPAATEPQP